MKQLFELTVFSSLSIKYRRQWGGGKHREQAKEKEKGRKKIGEGNQEVQTFNYEINIIKL